MIGSDNLNMQNVIEAADERKPEKKNYLNKEKHQSAGHITERAFLKYIRVSKLDTAKRLNEHIKLKWNNNLMRVA